MSELHIIGIRTVRSLQVTQKCTLNISLSEAMQSLFTGPQPPTGVSVDITVPNTAVVSWNAQQSRMCDVVVGNYSVRYQLTNDTGSTPITVYTSSTSVTLNGLVPNAVYSVSVATIASGRSTSEFSAATPFTVTATAMPHSKYI